MQPVVLLVTGDVALAARIQRVLQERVVPTYFSMSAARASQAIDELQANVVGVDRNLSDGAIALLEQLSVSHPRVERVLLVQASSGFHRSAQESGLVRAVTFEVNLPAVVQRIAAGRPQPATEYALGGRELAHGREIPDPGDA